MLPQEIWRCIYSFDATYRDIYSTIIKEFNCACCEHSPNTASLHDVSIRLLIQEKIRLVTTKCPHCGTSVTTSVTTSVRTTITAGE